uniref:Putative receptor protein kinase TMK1 n=1 Tax=Noccaea caerulescens TaxID=107243 RepID=A0A1J3DV57_NOCCA
MTNFWCLLCLCVWCFMSVVEKAESVDTLLSIASDLGYSGWKGSEPCQHHWYGVACIGGRIIGIMLVAENLTGVISPRFADIRSLRVIDLSHNRLRGTIPSELTRLNLTSLDLSYNQLHGKVPPFKATVVQLQGNPGIETKTRGTHRGLIIGIIVLSVLLIGVACLAVYREMRRRRRRPEPREVTTLDEY